MTHFQRAIALSKEVGDERHESRARMQAAVCAALGRLSFDQEELTVLHAVARRSSDPWLESQTHLARGFFLDGEGDYDSAREAFVEAGRVARRAGLRYLAICGKLNEGSALEFLGNDTLARTRYEEGLELCASSGARRLQAVIQTFVAGIWARNGNLSEASRVIKESRKHFQELEDTLFPSFPDLQAGQLDLAKARAAVTVEEAAHHRARARQCLEDADQRTRSQPSSYRCQFTCAARALLEKQLRHDENEPAVTLTLHPDAANFRLDDNPSVDLGRADLVQKVLLALVEHRNHHPGAYLPTEQLFESVWTGESVSPKARSMRVRNVIYRLRELGLAGVLSRSKAGYRLDPQILVAMEVRKPR